MVIFRNILLLTILNLILLSRIQTFAQTPTDPFSIKLKSFTPPPTRSPTVTPTTAVTLPAAISITNGPSAVPTVPSGDICTLSNRGFPADCGAMGLPLQLPKPRYLRDTSLCTLSTMYPFYSAAFVPPDLTNLNSALGGKFWVRDTNIKFNKCLAENLGKMLKYIENNYNCVVFIGYGWRSYAEQEALWKGKNCSTNPNCGVAPPGKSLHQAGIATDLFCAKLTGGNLILENIPDISGILNNYSYIRPLPGLDPPHFIGL